MNKRNRLNLDILSRINEKIVDEVTLMRIERMNRKKSNRKKILAFGSLAASVALVFGVIFVVLLLMKQVPVYTGMTVSSANPVTAEQVAANPEDYVAIRLSGRSMRVTPMTALGNGKGNNGNGKGNQPAQTTDASMQASGGETIYYAKAGEDIYITVHIDNPDDYIILQFTLNGKVYNSYMFEDGSDMENLILKYNVGDLLGLTEFTLDNIKYLDDGDYKDVRLEGDTTVLVGVYTDQRPTASVTEAKVNFTSISATFSVKDVGNLIALTSGKARAVLYGQDGQRLDEKEVELTEETKVTFEDLIPAETYRLAVESEYDALDGNGRKTYTLYEQEIGTKTALRVSAKNVGQTGASFEAVWDEAIDDRKIAKVGLYRDGTLQTNVSVGLEGLEGLLSDCDYTLRVDYEYKGKTYTLNVPFHTAAKTEPTYVIETPTKTQTSIGFDLTESDPDNIGTATKIELLHKGVIVKTENADVRSFTDLLSNNEYTVRVTYTYDLNDGTGAQTKTAELAVRTEAKTEPTYVIENPTKTQTSIGFDLTETDPDNIGTATKIELWKDGQIVKTAATVDVRSFTDLTSYSQYILKITYTYDLNDGTGVHEKTVEKIINTPAKEITVTDIQTVSNATVIANEEVTLRVAVNNPDDAPIQSFVIGGVTVPTTLFGTNSYILNYVPADGGKTVLSCSAISYTLFNETYIQGTSYTDTDSVIVLGEVSIAKVELQSGKNVFEDGEEIIAVVTFVGSEGYEMKSIGLRGSYSSSLTRSLTKLTDTTYSFVLPNTSSIWSIFQYQITSVTYGIGSSTDTVEITSERFACAVLPKQDSVIDISTPEQLQNMEAGKAYRLAQDIDMTGFDWQPYILDGGYLDGNGYKIKNLTITKWGPIILNNTTKENGGAGMFSQFSGVLKDVVLENASMELVRLNNQSGFVGFLVGLCSIDLDHTNLLMVNCSVQGNMTIYNGRGHGLIGSTYDAGGTFFNCEYIGTITCLNSPNVDFVNPARPLFGSDAMIDVVHCISYCDIIINGEMVPVEYHYSMDNELVGWNHFEHYSYSQRPNQ